MSAILPLRTRRRAHPPSLARSQKHVLHGRTKAPPRLLGRLRDGTSRPPLSPLSRLSTSVRCSVRLPRKPPRRPSSTAARGECVCRGGGAEEKARAAGAPAARNAQSSSSSSSLPPPPFALPLPPTPPWFSLAALFPFCSASRFSIVRSMFSSLASYRLAITERSMSGNMPTSVCTPDMAAARPRRARRPCAWCRALACRSARGATPPARGVAPPSCAAPSPQRSPALPRARPPPLPPSSPPRPRSAAARRRRRAPSISARPRRENPPRAACAATTRRRRKSSGKRRALPAFRATHHFCPRPAQRARGADAHKNGGPRTRAAARARAARRAKTTRVQSFPGPARAAPRQHPPRRARPGVFTSEAKSCQPFAARAGARTACDGWDGAVDNQLFAAAISQQGPRRNPNHFLFFFSPRPSPELSAAHLAGSRRPNGCPTGRARGARACGAMARGGAARAIGGARKAHRSRRKRTPNPNKSKKTSTDFPAREMPLRRRRARSARRRLARGPERERDFRFFFLRAPRRCEGVRAGRLG